jgi:prefoldin subunit 5
MYLITILNCWKLSVARSFEVERKTGRVMEKILEKLEKMKVEIKKMRNENKEVKGEIERVRKQFKDRGKKWEEEKNNMSEIVSRLERKMEMKKGKEEKLTQW